MALLSTCPRVNFDFQNRPVGVFQIGADLALFLALFYAYRGLPGRINFSAPIRDKAAMLCRR